MEAGLLGLQLVAGCVLLASADIPMQPNLDLQRLSGLWQPIAGAHRGRERTELEKELEKLPFRLAPSDDGNLKLKYNRMLEDGCVEQTFLLQRSGKSSKFTLSDRVTIHVIGTDYNSYIISHIDKTTFSGIYLSGREREVGKDIRQKFIEVAGRQGYPEDTIWNAVIEEPCTLRD